MSDSNNKVVITDGVKGAAWIISEMVVEQLVNEGIIDEPVVLREDQDGLFLGRFNKRLYLTYDSDPALSSVYQSVKLWMPESIPADKWQTAVAQFDSHKNLAENISRRLISQYSDIKELVPYKQLLEKTESILLGAGILHKPIRIKGQDMYFFDEAGIYRRKPRPPEYYSIRSHFLLWDNRVIGTAVWTKAVMSFQEGNTLRECIDLYYQTKIYSNPPCYSPLELLVTKVYPATYERVPENENKRTFDFIRVYVNLSHTVYDSWDQLREGVQNNKNAISNMVVEKIANDQRFKRFGVPISALRLSSITLTKGYALEYIFELKDIEGLQSDDTLR